MYVMLIELHTTSGKKIEIEEDDFSGIFLRASPTQSIGWSFSSLKRQVQIFHARGVKNNAKYMDRVNAILAERAAPNTPIAGTGERVEARVSDLKVNFEPGKDIVGLTFTVGGKEEGWALHFCTLYKIMCEGTKDFKPVGDIRS